MSLSELSPFNPRKFKTTTIVLATLVIVSLVPLRSLAQKDFLPPEIQDIELGISSSQVIDKIKNSGEHSTSDSCQMGRGRYWFGLWRATCTTNR